MNLVIKLRKARRWHFLSQRELAQSIGLGTNSVVRMETDGRLPDLPELIKLCAVLQLEVTSVIQEIVSDLAAESRN